MKNGLFSLAGLFCSVSLLVAAPKNAQDSGAKFTWTRGIIQSVDQTDVDHPIDEVHGIATDAHGNVYVAGTFSGNISFGSTNLVQDPTPEGYFYQDSYFAKYNPGGELLWVKQGKTTENHVQGWDAACDSKGNVYFLGTCFLGADFGDVTFPPTYGSVLLKYDANGNVLWSRVATSTEPKKIVIDKDDNVLLTGWIVFGPANFGNGVVSGTVSFPDFNFFVAKYDSAGNALWAHTQEDALNGLSYPGSVAVDKNGEVYVTGVFWGNLVLANGNTTLSTEYPVVNNFIIKYGVDGSFLWAKQFSTDQIYLSGTDMDVDQNGNLLIAGVSGSGGFLAGLTSGGDLTWVKQLNNVAPTALYLAKDGKAYLGGAFGGTASFDSYQLTANGDSDGFLAGLDVNGNFSFVAAIGGAGNQSVAALTSNSKGDVYVAGTFAYQSTFGSTFFQSAGGQNVFFSRMLIK